MNWLKFFIIALFIATFSSCGSSDDAAGGGDSQEPDTPRNVDISLLTGTWGYDWNNDNNIDYLSFDGNGNGELVEAGGLFTNLEFFTRSNKFTYSTDKNNIALKFESGKNGKIEVTSLSKSRLTFKRTQFEYSWNTSEPQYIKVSNKYDWFYSEGPASEDLTTNVCGTYKGQVYNADGSVFEKYAQITITKINNYSVEVKNSWNSKLNDVCYLDWNRRNDNLIEIYRKSGSYSYKVIGDNIELGYLTGGGAMTFKGSKNENIGNGGFYSGTIGGHDYVDLGLSVKWATCNIGANDLEAYGNYYAWGETNSKENYTWNTYMVTGSKCGTVSDPLYNYVVSSNKSICSTKYDAAYAIWGKNWRMPTKDEVEELLDKCTFYWSTDNMINGCIVVGPNGNKLFLPAAGWVDEHENENKSKRGYYWIANSHDEIHAYYLRVGDGVHDILKTSRCIGVPIRAVSK